MDFLIWVKLSDKYEEAVLKKNPKFFEELYQKAKELQEVKYTYYHGKSTLSTVGKLSDYDIHMEKLFSKIKVKK